MAKLQAHTNWKESYPQVNIVNFLPGATQVTQVKVAVAVPLLSVTTRPSRTLQTLRRVFVFSSSNGGWESSGPVLQSCIDTEPLLLLTFTHEGNDWISFIILFQ